MRRCRFLPLIALLLATHGGAATAADPPGALLIAASLPPVHSIAAAVAEGLAEPVLLLPGGSSPHSHSLRPSQAQALQSADLVIWVGPGLETFLAKALSQLQAEQRSLRLADVEGLVRWPARHGGLWAASEDAEAGHEHAAEGADEDPHYWLDPRNAALWARAIAARLAGIRPAAGERLRANAAALERRLGELDARIGVLTAPHAARPFVVFHDAYQYFERRYGLSAAGSIAIAADRPPGARRLVEIRASLRERAAVCLFAEPQFAPRLAEVLVAGTQVRLGRLDPLGAGLSPGPDLYPRLLTELGASLAECLSP